MMTRGGKCGGGGMRSVLHQQGINKLINQWKFTSKRVNL
uniref:Uncharacterized protein n=1 Tax=Anguilla anguilla TaxID=7936 RepID=A0A0E9Q745_ANGAN